MDRQRRETIYRIHHDTGVALRRLVRESHKLPLALLASRYGVLRKPSRSS